MVDCGGFPNLTMLEMLVKKALPIFIPFVFVPHNKKVETLLQTALTQGRISPDLSAALNDKVNILAHYVEEAIVLVVAALMVLKPF